MYLPVGYDHMNTANSMVSPSTVHCTDTGLSRFFQKYLFQKAMSVFDWELPEHWAEDYFLYGLFCFGHMAVVRTDKFGVIPQYCGLTGYDVFYRPTHATISNPLLTGILTPRIGRECTVFKMNADYSGIWDIVSFYADNMALCAQTAGVNMLNSKLSYVFFAKDKAAAESYKKMMDKILSGEPLAVVGKDLYANDGTKSWDLILQNVGQNYIVGDVLEDLRKWENMFSTAVGLPNANTQKKERMIVDEVNANNVETDSNARKWLERFEAVAAETNEMFGLSISVRLRQDTETEVLYNGLD